jgi:glutamine---fructose-6-phosphate transaminase (isomerizing)
MCGIVGYIGEKEAQPILMDCLEHLEYRGYDSCGIAVDGNSVAVFKDAGRVADLKQRAPVIEGCAGIGHTRWATHGEPSRENAHPHSNYAGNISVVHNGIIDNHQQLRDQLIAEGHTLCSDTDTEIIPHLIDKYYDGDILEALTLALKDIRGSYALVVLCHGENRLLAARADSPMVIGIGDRENFIASDVPAIIDYTSRVIYPEDGDICDISGSGISITNQGKKVLRAEQRINWSVEDARKGGYEHYMLKEIYEQPRIIRDTVGSFLSEGSETSEQYFLPEGTGKMLLLACGTSYHAAMVAKLVGEEMLKIPIRLELASEFSYQANALAGNTTIVISQSGETADILKAMKRIKANGGQLIAVTNVVASSISRLADRTIYTLAGPEISVAATKSFTAQLMAMYLVMLANSVYEERRLIDLRAELRQLAGKIQQILDDTSAVKKCAERLAQYEHAFFIGRGINYPIALEGALKMKEISYLHAEGYAAGELKHGSFALLGKDNPVVAIVANDSTYGPMLTTVKEIKSRSSPIIAIVQEGDEQIDTLADDVITVPVVSPIFTPVVNTVVLQLLAYYTASQRGCSIDFPRNLAKSVTVE